MSPINFDRQKSRPLFVDERKAPHEARFAYYHNLPGILSQVHNSSPVNFKKYIKRNELFP